MHKIMIALGVSPLLCLLVGGCVTKHNPAQTEIVYPGVGIVKYHCPPGQRKQGNCY